MSAVSIHNLANNIQEATRSYESTELRTMDTNDWLVSRSNFESLAQCNGSNQSPIRIATSTTRENLNLRLGLTAFDKPIAGFLANQFPTFRLVPFSFEWPKPSALVSTSIARSYNPYADSHFILNHVQFHWPETGEESSGGQLTSVIHQIVYSDSNRTVSNQSPQLDSRATMEIHFVHTNTAYENLDEAFTKPDGLMILAVLAVPSTHESYVFDRILDKLANVTKHGEQVEFNEDSTWRTLLPVDTSRFYRYHGSLIWPPCHESVQWIVFDERLKLGSRQLKRLRRLKFMGRDLKTGIQIDWSNKRRALQPLNNRTIERSFNWLSRSSRTTGNSVSSRTRDRQ